MIFKFYLNCCFHNLEAFFTAHFTFYTYGDQSNFDRYKFPAKASTYKVTGGGWAMYAEADFKGKVMYHFGSEYCTLNVNLVLIMGS